MPKSKKCITKTIQPYDYERKGKTVQVKKPFPRRYHIKNTRIKIVKKKETVKKSSQKDPMESKASESESDIRRIRELQALQLKRKDWVHLSVNYPNLIALTDEEVENYKEARYKKFKEEYKIKDDSEKKEYIADLDEYIRKIKCYNQNDIMTLCEKVHKEFEEQKDSKYGVSDPHRDKTVYITSPRGGLEVLSDYAYANNLPKNKIPFDFYSGDTGLNDNQTILYSKSLPYGDYIKNVDDIVYVDDICMTGEQETWARDIINKSIKELGISEKQRPRIHYVALVGNELRFEKKGSNLQMKSFSDPEIDIQWDTVSIGELHNFEYSYDINSVLNDQKKYVDISAVVFPYSIPDDGYHKTARELYSHHNKYRHLPG